VAAGWGVPITWGGTAEGLPDGYSAAALARAVTTHQATIAPNTLVICAGQVRRDAGRMGLAAALLQV